MDEPSGLPHEKLNVYHVALELVGEAETMLGRLPRRGFKDGDQLGRAATGRPSFVPRITAARSCWWPVR